jgi:hypothetical protein
MLDRAERKMHKYMRVIDDNLCFYLTARFNNSYQAGSNNEPYFVKLSFLTKSTYYDIFIFKIMLYSKSLMHKRLVTKTFVANTINNFYFDAAVTYNDVIQSHLIYGDNKISIRNALHSKFTSFVAYSVVECFIMRDFPNLIKSIDFNPIIKKMFYFKNHV